MSKELSRILDNYISSQENELFSDEADRELKEQYKNAAKKRIENSIYSEIENELKEKIKSTVIISVVIFIICVVIAFGLFISEIIKMLERNNDERDSSREDI